MDRGSTPSKWACRSPSSAGGREARILSSMKDERVAAQYRARGPNAEALHRRRAKRHRRRARRALRQQDHRATRRASCSSARPARLYNWDLNFGDIATIWRGGCIIRAASSTASPRPIDENPRAGHPDRGAVLPQSRRGRDRQLALRRGRPPTELGIPIPGFSSASRHYDALRTERLPARSPRGCATSSARTPTAVSTPIRAEVPHPMERRPQRGRGLVRAELGTPGRTRIVLMQFLQATARLRPDLRRRLPGSRIGPMSPRGSTSTCRPPTAPAPPSRSWWRT